jgi:putative ABC transport system ATP-binding protein
MMEFSAMPERTPAAEVQELTRIYKGAGQDVHALRGVSLSVLPGEVVAVMGPSGSGKSTLLSLLGGLDEPDAGSIRILGTDWRLLQGSARSRFRRKHCAFIIQGFALLPQATAAENVELPLLLDGMATSERRERVDRALDRIGLCSHASKLPDELSGGEQQRLAIARAIVSAPSIVLADEPTASLDSTNAQQVARLLVSSAREHRTAMVLVTHDSSVAEHADRIVRLRSGCLAGDHLGENFGDERD